MSDSHRALDICQYIESNYSAVEARLEALARRWLGSRLADAQDAEDLVQDTLTKAVEKREAFRGETEAELEAWLGALLKHRAANLVSREARGRAAEDRLSRESPRPATDVGEALEQIDALSAILARLTDDERAILGGRYLDGLGWNELGRRLGREPDAVRLRASRTLLRLRDLLIDAGKALP